MQICNLSPFKHENIEEYIESLEDYQTRGRALITLEDYFPYEVKELLTELDESQEKEPLVETCRVTTVHKTEAWDDDDDDEDDGFELYLSNGNDSLHEQLYDRYGRPYISKKQRKRQAFKERSKCLTQDCKDLQYSS